ncbi:hypothetical protein [Rhodoblastus acidophilus]|nr:hypothetical protein [Rhodoblastus acidophilus]
MGRDATKRFGVNRRGKHTKPVHKQCLAACAAVRSALNVQCLFRRLKMQNELKPMNSNIIRFPIERVATPTTDVLRALAPDARQVSLVAEAFGIDEPDWIIRDRADAEMWANVATRTDLPADAARRRAALEAMLKPFVKEAARLCRKSREDARRSDEAAGKLLAARNEGGYWLDALEDALTSRTYAWASGLIEAYEACQEAFGAERAIGIAIRGERWAPVDHDKDVEVLLLAAAR